jgi:hypothetical protein
MTRRTNSALASLAAVLAATALGAGCTSDSSAEGTTSTSGNGSTSTSGTGSTTGSTSGSTTGTSGPGGRGTFVAYRDFDSCDDFLAWTRKEMLERVTPYGLDHGFYPHWREGDVIAEERPTEFETADTEAASDDASGAPGEPASAPATTAPGTSTTNTQEVGVDEGDLTETDGRFVYSVFDDHVRSVDLETQKLISDIELTRGEHQMILFGQRLLVVTRDWSTGTGETVARRFSVGEDGTLTEGPASHLEGNLVAVRSIDGVARIVMQQPFATRLEFVQPRSGGEDEEDAALEQNRRVIEEATAEQLLPRSYVQNENGTTSAVAQALPCDQVGAPEEFAGFNIVWVATVDLVGEPGDPAGAAGVVATAEATYASARSLYVSTTVYPDVAGETVPVNAKPPSTHLLAFDLGAADGAEYVASGEISGELLNQYSMSEHDGHLRVATTTTAGGFGNSQESGVRVLKRDGESLVEVGAVGGLGIGEEIQAVRFLGDVGYVVTFRRVDPLFVLDLSNPTAPALVGELKVPGYSTYLHPVADDRLLAIGYAGDDNGLTGDMQLSLFDVSDLTNPTLLSTLPLVGWSEAAFDPHGFLYWPETGQVVVPKDVLCFQHIFDCTSAIVARINGDSLEEQGRLFSWWPIRRSMIARGELVTVSSIGTKVWTLDTLEALADIRFDVPNTDEDENLD